MEHSIYLVGIKKALKARGTTYSDLAIQLKMTESGIKKMLNAKDISFRRVLQICEILNVLPGQLFSLSERMAIPEVRLSEIQENALLKDRQLLSVYWRFSIERLEFEEIAQLQGMTALAVKSKLQRLVTLNLISQRRGRFLIKPPVKFRWANDSKLAKVLNLEWSQLTLNRALAPSDQNDRFHRLVALKLSKSTYDQIVRQFSEVIDQIVQTSEREELTISKQELRDFTLLMATAKGSVFDGN